MTEGPARDAAKTALDLQVPDGPDGRVADGGGAREDGASGEGVDHGHYQELATGLGDGAAQADHAHATGAVHRTRVVDPLREERFADPEVEHLTVEHRRGRLDGK